MVYIKNEMKNVACRLVIREEWKRGFNKMKRDSMQMHLIKISEQAQ